MVIRRSRSQRKFKRNSGLLAAVKRSSGRGERLSAVEALEDRHLLSGTPANQDEFDQAIQNFVASNPQMYFASLKTGDLTYSTRGYVPKPASFTPSQSPKYQVAAQQRITEAEPTVLTQVGAIRNNTPGTAQSLPLGFGLTEFEAIDVRGTLGEVAEPAGFVPTEDDGSIILANDIGLTAGQTVAITGNIGDGPNANVNFLDTDFYAITGAKAGDVITAYAGSKGLAAPVDPAVLIYDASGRLLAYNDDILNNYSSFAGGAKNPTTTDSFIAFDVPEDGDYYVAVVGSSGAGNLLGFEVPPDPFDSFSKETPSPTLGDYVLTLGLNGFDQDYYAVQLDGGDIFGANISGAAQDLALYNSDGELLMGSSQDLGATAYSTSSPLPTGGNASLARVIPATGTYYLRALGSRSGGYLINARVFRPAIEDDGDNARQVLYLDFNGAELNNAIFGGGGERTVLSPLGAFMAGFNLDGGFQNAVIDSVIATVTENLVRDMKARGNNPNFTLEIRNSRDHQDPFGQPNISRVVVGGTFEELYPQFGFFGNPGLLGIAQSVDVGNFNTEETAVILLDLLADPDELTEVSLNTYPVNPRSSAARAQFVGQAIGNIVSHEAGHFFGNWHTDDDIEPTNGFQQQIDLTTRGVNDLMDKSSPIWMLYGVGPDRIWGTRDDQDIDFIGDDFDPDEHFRGYEDTLNTLAFVLTSGRTKTAEASGWVWNDIDGDGVQDSGEQGIKDALVYADINNDQRFGIGEPAARTDANGFYYLRNLEPGLVTIRAAGQPGWTQTVPANNGSYSVEVSPTKVIEGLKFAFRVGEAVNEGFDSGDAPTPYPAASAGILAGFRLGNQIDGDGQLPLNAAANGDDTTGVDDEDGVQFLSQLVPTLSASVQMNAFSGTSPKGLLHGWIDFDRDGIFEDSEQIVKAQRAVDGANTFSFAVPAAAVPGTTYARFRLAYEPTIGPGGRASAGEVEDYTVTIQPPPVTAPTANADSFTVDGNTTNNSLDVLANDLANVSGGLTIVSVGGASQGGTLSVNANQDRVLYTPAAGFDGIESFSYTIRNSVGGQSSATVSVTVRPFVNPNPVANDDTATFSQDSLNNVINVLANDTAPAGKTISVGEVGTPSQGGTVEIAQGGQSVIYTPAAGFAGTETFTYVARTPDGKTDDATVTVTVTPVAQGALARFRLRAVDGQGASVQTLSVGQEFTLEAYVDDLRSNPDGVFSAYVDVLFAADKFTANGSFVYGPGFDFARSGEIITSGNAAGFNDVGALGGLSPTDKKEHLLFSIKLTPTQAGTFGFQTKIADDEQIGIHDVVLYGLDNELVPSEMDFTSLTLTAANPAQTLTNPSNPLDVNGDGSVSPVDSLLVINSLNRIARGISAASRAGEGESTKVFLDVNGDGNVSPIDALLVINRLNQISRSLAAPAPLAAMSESAAVDQVWQESNGEPAVDDSLLWAALSSDQSKTKKATLG